jgi:hypothetical protein
VRASATLGLLKMFENGGSAIRVRTEWHCTLCALSLEQDARRARVPGAMGIGKC